MTKVSVISTGTGNVASMMAALRAAGGHPSLTASPNDVASASHVVLPGVSSFGAAMEGLRAANLVQPVLERVQAGLPTLFVCVGLQILGEASAESPGVQGLGVVSGKVSRLPDDRVLVPQQGWNHLVAGNGARILKDGHAYFSNSYALTTAPLDWHMATSFHGTKFVAALEKGCVVACQFHPELSGELGAHILTNWLSAVPLPRSVPKRRVLECDAQGPAPSASRSVVQPADHHQPAPAPPTTLTRRVIPCLDVKGGRVVKGVSFSGLRDAGDPVELAVEYERQGADELVMLDISATPEDRATAADTVRAICGAVLLPLCVGGGIRDTGTAQTLLEAGADKVAVNSAAVANPELISQLAKRFGSQCVVLAIDAVRKEDGSGWEVVVKSGKSRTGKDVVAWAKQGVELGAGEILLTSWDQDGKKSGFDCELVRAVSGVVKVPVIASGGGSTAQHMIDALQSGADAVLAASIFHFGEKTIGGLKTEMNAIIDASAQSIRLRPAPPLKLPCKRVGESLPQAVIGHVKVSGGKAVLTELGDDGALSVRELEESDVAQLVRRFGVLGEVAVTDLDAANNNGDNRELIADLIRNGEVCRVGGGVRSEDDALFWLNLGASKVVVDQDVAVKLVGKLPAERVAVDVQADDTLATRLRSLQASLHSLPTILLSFASARAHAANFSQLSAALRLLEGTHARVVVSGAVTTPAEIASLDNLGVQSQLCDALCTRALSLGDALLAPAITDRSDGLLPTVVVGRVSGGDVPALAAVGGGSAALGLAYSSRESVRVALDNMQGTYWSRGRGLWVKGASSGHTQVLVSAVLDCDRDTLRFEVDQVGGFCHVDGQDACFGNLGGIAKLEHSIRQRIANAPPNSYTHRLLSDHSLLRAKLVEEATELGEADPNDKSAVAGEFADVMYFASVAALRAGVGLADLDRVLDTRALRVTRRKGDAKPKFAQSVREADAAAAAAAAARSTPAPAPAQAAQHARDSGLLRRDTNETKIEARVAIDGSGKCDAQTGLGFLDHMVSALAKHSKLDIVLHAQGDLHVDDHHTVEDCGILLGRAFDKALGERKGIHRWGHALCPLDEALSRAVVDISGRPFAKVVLQLRRERIGEVSTEMLAHFLESFATSARVTMHVEVLSGDNDHHKAESAFKALAVALRAAVARDGNDVPSTKAVLE